LRKGAAACEKWVGGVHRLTICQKRIRAIDPEGLSRFYIAGVNGCGSDPYKIKPPNEQKRGLTICW
jgi:hypothetical protein